MGSGSAPKVAALLVLRLLHRAKFVGPAPLRYVTTTRPPFAAATRARRAPSIRHGALPMSDPTSPCVGAFHVSPVRTDTNTWSLPPTFFRYTSAPVPSGAIAMSENRLMSALGPSIDCVVTAAEAAAGRASAATAVARAARVRRVMRVGLRFCVPCGRRRAGL